MVDRKWPCVVDGMTLCGRWKVTLCGRREVTLCGRREVILCGRRDDKMQQLANSTDTCGDDGDNDNDCVRTLTTKDRLFFLF